ncbi:oac-29 [Pristionchus pacificus]|uniref:Oac-29 n=1 Tax=Pristionchus pacificus TaxID=54126 RepID=A0A454Y6K3_PRIPA|nr:oac-29 [Pristionchus pacificus]|eukprot:PDM79141.1 oac-29 [Pristionchus pacificus]
MTKAHQKRNDIQGLRAIAIFGVLLFHLAPKRFMNGFLGVDMFFVLSGYLMSSILSREGHINGRVIKTFYIRRFKRIVPLYSMMLVLLAIVTPLVFLPSDVSHFVTDLEWALPFAENMQNVLKQFDYWDEVFNSPVLLHAWSLGVEIQYYLLVPFIMIVARYGQTSSFRMSAFLVFITENNILASYFIHFCASSTVSFGFLFARVWQFLTGSIFFELESVVDDPNAAQYQPIDQQQLLDDGKDGFKDDDAEIGKPQMIPPASWRIRSYFPMVTIASYSVTIYILWMVIVAITGPTLSRFLVTLATGVILLTGKFRQNAILSNEIVVYIGDLSYTIYLAHWPVIILYKYYNDLSELSIADMSFCLLATLFISVLVHHTLESFFIAASTTVVVIFVGGVYTLILVGLITGGMQRLSEHAHPAGQIIDATVPSIAATGAGKAKYNVQEAIAWNQAQSRLVYFSNPEGCARDFEAERWTGHKSEGSLRCVSSGNGTAKVLLLGNSYGYRAFPVLHRLFAGRYAQMRMFTMSSRVYLTEDKKTTSFANKEKIVVEKFQPDITFLVEKDTFKTLLNPIEGAVEEDPITKHVQAAIDVLSNNSGTVIIDRQYLKPELKDGTAYLIQKRLQLGKTNFEDLKMSRKDYESAFDNEIKRMATIKNENVIMNSVEDQLCPGDQCYFYDRETMHAYYGDVAAHLTSEGLKLLEPKYKEIIEDFLLRMQSRQSEAP